MVKKNRFTLKRIFPPFSAEAADMVPARFDRNRCHCHRSGVQDQKAVLVGGAGRAWTYILYQIDRDPVRAKWQKIEASGIGNGDAAGVQVA
jgi:hypothetical protein